MTEPLRFAGKMMSARVSERAGYWFACMSAADLLDVLEDGRYEAVIEAGMVYFGAQVSV